MPQRHKDALAIIDGACNPVAIVGAIKRAYDEIQNEPVFLGTESYTSAPAVRLMLHQLAYISGVVGTVHDWPIHEPRHHLDEFPLAYSECLRLAGGPVQEPAMRQTADNIDGYDRDDLGESPDY